MAFIPYQGDPNPIVKGDQLRSEQIEVLYHDGIKAPDVQLQINTFLAYLRGLTTHTVAIRSVQSQITEIKKDKITGITSVRYLLIGSDDTPYFLGP